MTSASLWMESQNLAKVPLFFRMKRVRILAPRVHVLIETDSYVVKTISKPCDLEETFRLRYDVFFREFAGRGNLFSLLPYDVDQHDFACDHLVVMDKASQKIIATYRLLFQEEGEKKKFYTDGEFDLSAFHAVPGNKLELGRACVHKDFRTGTVVGLLWKGMVQYAKKTNTRYLFGCSSLGRKEFAALPYIREQLVKRNALSEIPVPARSEFQLSRYPEVILPEVISEDHCSMPSLMNMYLLTGAKMGTELAYDAEMDCLDFFTVMDFSRLPASFERRFA